MPSLQRLPMVRSRGVIVSTHPVQQTESKLRPGDVPPITLGCFQLKAFLVMSKRLLVLTLPGLEFGQFIEADVRADSITQRAIQTDALLQHRSCPSGLTAV